MVFPESASSKTEVVVLKDFLAYPGDLPAHLAEHDACIWALGTTSVGMTEKEYTKITYGYVMVAIKALEDDGVAKRREREGANPFRFLFVSADNADQTGRSFQMQARVKVRFNHILLIVLIVKTVLYVQGRTEKALLDIPSLTSIKASVIRPGYFFPTPLDSAHIRGVGRRVLDNIFTPLFSTLIPSKYTTVEGMGKVAVALVKGQWSDERLVSAKRMNEMAREL